MSGVRGWGCGAGNRGGGVHGYGPAESGGFPRTPPVPPSVRPPAGSGVARPEEVAAEPGQPGVWAAGVTSSLLKYGDVPAAWCTGR